MTHAVVHFEIIGPDGPALERFYAGVFGWGVQWVPGMNYGIVDTHAGEGINGGMGTSQDASSFLTFYVEATDPQAVLDRAESLGAKTVMPLMEIPGVVTFGQFADPQGNVIGVVQGEEGSEGGGPSAGTNPSVSWFEVLGNDPRALWAFYRDLFDWHVSEGGVPGQYDYGEVDTHAGRGINGGIGTGPSGPAVLVYARVPDCGRSLAEAEALGATALMKPADVNERLTVAIFGDPAGNAFGLYTFKG